MLHEYVASRLGRLSRRQVVTNSTSTEYFNGLVIVFAVTSQGHVSG